MAWLPKISVGPWIGCYDDGEVDGVALLIVWGRYELELILGRHNGRFR